MRSLGRTRLRQDARQLGAELARQATTASPSGEGDAMPAQWIEALQVIHDEGQRLQAVGVGQRSVRRWLNTARHSFRDTLRRETMRAQRAQEAA